MVDSIVMCKCLIFLVIQLQMCHLAGKKKKQDATGITLCRKRDILNPLTLEKKSATW